MRLVKTSKNTKKNTNKKRSLLAKIHIAKKELELSDEDYRRFIKELTGKDSCKDMSLRELLLVLDGFYVLGFVPKVKLNWDAINFNKDGMCFYIEQTAKAFLGSNWEKRLGGYIKKRFGVDALRFLGFKELLNVFAFLRGTQKLRR